MYTRPTKSLLGHEIIQGKITLKTKALINAWDKKKLTAKNGKRNNQLKGHPRIPT